MPGSYPDILQNLGGGGSLPAALQISKLTSVQKSGQALVRLDNKKYRGISVAVFSGEVISLPWYFQQSS
jgi:hypothetical protein